MPYLECPGYHVWREFPSTPGSVVSAGHALDSLRAELGDPVHMAAVLLVSELVSNSIRYSKATSGVIELLACITPERLHVEVSDDGEGLEQPARGLQLVQDLADRWGRPTGLRTSVWFEIHRDAATGRQPAPRPELRLVASA
jgi:two-component sensor histidine kinase